MHGLTPILEEFLDLRLWIERRDQLDPALADRDQGHLDAFGLEPLPAAETQAEQPFVGLDRPIEIANGNPDVVDPAEHAVDSKAGWFPRPLTRCGPFVVGLITASYVTVRLPLFTPRPLQPSVDGASDPTEGRRLDREPHRWHTRASVCRAWGDFRAWRRGSALGRTPSTNAVLGIGGDLTGDQRRGRARRSAAAAATGRRHDLRGSHAGSDAIGTRRSFVRSPPSRVGSGVQQRSFLGGRLGLGRGQRVFLWLLHVVGRPQAPHPVARERLPVVVERPSLWFCRGADP